MLFQVGLFLFSFFGLLYLVGCCFDLFLIELIQPFCPPLQPRKFASSFFGAFLPLSRVRIGFPLRAHSPLSFQFGLPLYSTGLSDSPFVRDRIARPLSPDRVNYCPV